MANNGNSLILFIRKKSWIQTLLCSVGAFSIITFITVLFLKGELALHQKDIWIVLGCYGVLDLVMIYYAFKAILRLCNTSQMYNNVKIYPKKFINKKQLYELLAQPVVNFDYEGKYNKILKNYLIILRKFSFIVLDINQIKHIEICHVSSSSDDRYRTDYYLKIYLTDGSKHKVFLGTSGEVLFSTSEETCKQNGHRIIKAIQQASKKKITVNYDVSNLFWTGV